MNSMKRVFLFVRGRQGNNAWIVNLGPEYVTIEIMLAEEPTPQDQ